MSRSVVKNADRHARTLQRPSASFMKQYALNVAALQRFLLSQWKEKAIIAANALQKENQLNK